jgi:hypothetical protein
MAAIAYFMIYKQMPHYALQQVEKATVKRNQALFEKYVDVDALSESLARQFVSYATRYKDAEIAGQDPQAIAREYTPELNNVFKTIVIDYIQHGKYPSAWHYGNYYQKIPRSHADAITGLHRKPAGVCRLQYCPL